MLKTEVNLLFNTSEISWVLEFVSKYTLPKAKGENIFQYESNLLHVQHYKTPKNSLKSCVCSAEKYL